MLHYKFLIILFCFVQGFTFCCQPLNAKNAPISLSECPIDLIFNPDTTINSICLENVSCIENNILFNGVLFNEFIPEIRLLTNDKKQTLIISIHPGSLLKEFAQFRVIYTKNDTKPTDLVIRENVFITESGIKLGISLDKLLNIKGKPTIRNEKEGLSILCYRIDNIKSSNFLKCYNMPEYVAEYVFKDNHLITFKFGFIYP
jgi:hypothetical protein